MCCYAQIVCLQKHHHQCHTAVLQSTRLTRFCFVAPVITAEEERAEARRKFDENRKKHYNMRAVLQAHDDDEGEEVHFLSPLNPPLRHLHRVHLSPDLKKIVPCGS